MTISIKKVRPSSFYGTLFLLIILCFLVVVMIAKPSHATDPIIGFNPGRIIEDSVFTNTASLNAPQIQAFLNSKVPTCDTWGTQPSEFGGGTRAQWGTAHGYPPPYICLRDYSENGISAAQIIYNIAQQYQINPQVLIVLLQKEQALGTDTWPLPTQYRTATGYGCPDTAVCDTQYYGFTNQVTWSAKMFRAVLNNSPTWYSPYVLGNNLIQWSPNSTCGSSTVNIQNRSTQALYDYTPYQPNQAALNAGYGAGDVCSAYGNRNFYLYFRDWFGYNSGPAAFTTAGSSTIYVPVEGYKLTVPYAAAMQDYGISFEAVQTVSQAYVDAVPAPPSTTGISLNISHVVKSPYDTDEDGASIYLISRGKRYTIQSMQQLYDFGFKATDISYLPLSYIYSMSDGGGLSSFVTSPYGNVFKVGNLVKQVIFEYSTYITQNPSDRVTPLSYYLADKIVSGNPLTDRPVLVKNRDSEFVTLYQNNAYYSVPDYNVFSCWGLNSASFVPVYRIAQNDYIAPYTPKSALSCTVNDGQTTQVVNSSSRYTVPVQYGLSGTLLTTDLNNLLQKIPLRPTPLKPYVKSTDGAAVWYLDAGTRRLIPSYSSFTLLGLRDGDVDTVSPSVVNPIATNGIKLADGQLVKDPYSAAVFVIANNQRVLYSSSDLFTGYRNGWGTIETYSSTALDQYYPYQSNSVNNILVDKPNNKAYVVSPGNCFVLSDTSFVAIGKSYTTLSNAQSYDSSIFKSLNLSSCIPATTFIKQPEQGLVYWLDTGQKHPLNTYTAMLDKNGGASPVVMGADQSFLSNIPTGVSYY